MAFSIKLVTEQVRRLMQDTVEPYRWLDSEIRSHVADAVEHLHSVRPESRYVDGRLSDFKVDQRTEDILADDRWRESIVYYAAYKCYLDDDTDTVNAQLAESYLAKAEKWMQL